VLSFNTPRVAHSFLEAYLPKQHHVDSATAVRSPCSHHMIIATILSFKMEKRRSGSQPILCSADPQSVISNKKRCVLITKARNSCYVPLKDLNRQLTSQRQWCTKVSLSPGDLPTLACYKQAAYIHQTYCSAAVNLTKSRKPQCCSQRNVLHSGYASVLLRYISTY
jgi:hypothetical protein